VSTPAFADVVPLLPIDTEMTYRVPDDLAASLQVGCRVLVPLGVRWTTGIVTALSTASTVDEPRAIGEQMDETPAFTAPMLDLCRWIARYYCANLGDVLKSALPAGIHSDSGSEYALPEANGASDGPSEAAYGLPPVQRAVLALLRNGPASYRQIQRKLKGPSAAGNKLRSAMDALCRSGAVLRCQKMNAPRVDSLKERLVELIPSDARWITAQVPDIEKRAPRQAECIRRLWSAGGSLASSELTSNGISNAVLRALVERSIVRFGYREVRRDPFADDAAPDAADSQDHPPTQAQSEALQAITKSLGTFKVHLLHGVTGSGKTLIYVEAAAAALARGCGALILVPEIALTPQTVRRFRSSFGDNVAVLHSALSDAQRFDAWRDVQEGRRSVVIGARSAVFAPIPKLGVVIVDEEHDGSYKQSDLAPRYSARDVAVMRGMLEAAPVILGSATPSLESFQNGQAGKFNVISLPERVSNRQMPDVIVVDMKQEGGSIFSTPLTLKIGERLERGERIILLQNRRGHSPYVQCTACGQALECGDCQVSLTFHATGGRMQCHYCGREEPLPPACPECGGETIQQFGVGTQRVEEALNQQFPNARTLRMDVDTTRRKGSHDRILSAFRRGEADILLGTQMVSKGLDFPGVTLVGVISADTGIHLPDFRAGERTFQLLAQVSGRAGRGAIPGEVIIQTWLPQSKAVQAARLHDYGAFAEDELASRQPLGYPPFGRMALLLFKGRDESEVSKTASAVAQELRSHGGDVDVMGPVPAPLLRIRGSYRWQILLKSSSAAALNRLARIAGKGRFKQGVRGPRSSGQGGRSSNAGVRLDIDIDPVSML